MSQRFNNEFGRRRTGTGYFRTGKSRHTTRGGEATQLSQTDKSVACGGQDQLFTFNPRTSEINVNFEAERVFSAAGGNGIGLGVGAASSGVVSPNFDLDFASGHSATTEMVLSLRKEVLIGSAGSLVKLAQSCHVYCIRRLALAVAPNAMPGTDETTLGAAVL